MSSEMKTTGFEAFQKRIDEMGRKGGRAENASLRAGAAILQQAVINNVNRSSENHPHIKDHIAISRVTNNLYGEKAIKVGPDKEVAWRFKFLEFGTSKMQAQAPLSNASDESQGDVGAAISEVLKRELKF